MPSTMAVRHAGAPFGGTRPEQAPWPICRTPYPKRHNGTGAFCPNLSDIGRFYGGCPTCESRRNPNAALEAGLGCPT